MRLDLLGQQTILHPAHPHLGVHRGAEGQSLAAAEIELENLLAEFQHSTCISRREIGIGSIRSFISVAAGRLRVFYRTV
jgi:hypothetical protein